MSEDYLALQPLAMWNSVRGAWEKPMENLFCAHLELFSATWPAEGMMRAGQVYELPKQAHRITVSASSFLPTPKARDSQAEGYQAGLRRATPQVGTIVLALQRGDLLPTPNTLEHLPAREGEARERQLRRGGEESRRASSGNLREDILTLMPTTAARDYKDGNKTHERNGVVQTDTIARAVFNSGEVTETNWGKFEPAIRRWEQVIGRPAPAPTKPDGKDGAHRLSSEFTEWMMGLPEGWITDCGLSRNDELKACGNGVVPQQAELALRMLFDRIETAESSNRPG